MKNLIIIFNILSAIVITMLVPSCKDDNVELIVPSITAPKTDFSVDYKEGTIETNITSNVIYYANVDANSKKWLSYSFSDTCKTLTVNYAASDTTAARRGTITVSKGDAKIVLTVNQVGNPNALPGLLRVNIAYTLATTPTNMLRVTTTEAAKIPVGSTVVFECAGDVGSNSLINTSTYAEYAGGSPVNKRIQFIWTKEMATQAAPAGIVALLKDGIQITDMYCLFSKTIHAFALSSAGGYNFLNASAEEAAKIPVGANLVFECASNVTMVMLLNGQVPYASGSPVNGKFQITWTQEMADITAGVGIRGVLMGGSQVTAMYSIYVKNKIAYSLSSAGGYNFLNASADESAKIPLGATLVVVCADNVSMVMLLNGSTPFASGSPVKGKFTVVWTKEMAGYAKGTGIRGVLIGGSQVTDLYYHN
jgi:hypothetical protein